jgi:DNA-binding protein HU-beta
LTKQELAERVAEGAEMTKAEASRAVDAALAAITDALRAGDKVSIIGFGTFLVRERAARTGKNPQTGEPLQIPAGKSPAFKAGKALKDAVS